MYLINGALPELISDEIGDGAGLLVFSKDILNLNLFSNVELSLFATFIYSGFLIALLVENLSTQVRAR